MSSANTCDVDSLIGPEAEWVHRDVLSSEAVYKVELEQIFERAWLFLGHIDQVKNPGDFFLSRMGEESVIVSKDQSGTVHAFLNTCRHKGMRVCRFDRGNTTSFTCPYHAWTYNIDGRLLNTPGELTGVPGYRRFYHEELDKSQWGLVSVAKLAVYKGTIWATWDANAPELLDYLGPMKMFLDVALDCRDGREGGSELLLGVQKWRVDCNWKSGAENFIGDKAHGPSHRSVDAVGMGPSGGRGRRDNELVGDLELLAIGFPGYGHGAMSSGVHYQEPEHVPTFQLHPVVAEYFKKVHDDRVRLLGDKPRVRTTVGTIFPNMSFHAMQPRSIVVMHPVSATVTEFWRYYLVDRDAPDEVKDILRHYYMRYSGPGGMTEQDDMENWVYATHAAQGNVARRFPYNYSMGLGHSKPYEPIPGAIWCGVDTTEQNQRIYYRRWAQFAAGLPWSELQAFDD